MFRDIKIGAKLLLVILIVALGAVCVISVISYREMSMLSDTAINANRALADVASDESERALLATARALNERAARAKALELDALEGAIELASGAGEYEWIEDASGAQIAHTFESGAQLNEFVNAPTNGDGIIKYNAREYMLYVCDMPARGWTYTRAAPVDDIFYAAARARAMIETRADGARYEFDGALGAARARFWVLLILCAFVVGYVSWLLIRTITQPLNKLLSGVRRIGGGDLSGKVAVNGHDEIGELGQAFNAMTDDLQVYISSYTAAEAEKERLDGELSIAASIQNDMLPDVQERFGAEKSAKMFARMVAAKEVGGDFYDLFYIDEEHTKLCAVMADVSGKSVPAALFMVVAKTLIKTCFMQGNSPAEALMDANNILAEDNASSMFVTTFAGILDIQTGVFTFANAGHNPPLISKGGVFEYMKVRRSLPLAAMAGIKYRNEQVTLDKGDALFMYTDGVTEAMSESNDLFGETLLINALNASGADDPERMDDSVRDALAKHVGRAEQSDDITTLAIVYLGAGGAPLAEGGSQDE